MENIIQHYAIIKKTFRHKYVINIKFTYNFVIINLLKLRTIIIQFVSQRIQETHQVIFPIQLKFFPQPVAKCFNSSDRNI